MRLFSAAALCGAFALFAGAAEPTTRRSSDAKVLIVLAGDSTVTDTVGWGPGFEQTLTPEAQCINLAKGGRSSKSFIEEGSWKKCLALKPEYVLIQFGHNDQPGHKDAIRTEPGTTYKQYMTQYVDDAIAAGMKPVLVTSLSRRQWGEDGKVHSTLVPYVEVVKQIAAEKHVPLVDLHALSIALYEKIGKERFVQYEPVKTAATGDGSKPNPVSNADAVATTGPDTGKAYDGTHLNAKGAALIGPLVAEELKKQVPALAPYIK